MIKVQIEVSSGDALFSFSVRAESVCRALNIVEALYPGAQTRLVFPIEPETFFVKDPAAVVGLVELQMPKSVAG